MIWFFGTPTGFRVPLVLRRPLTIFRRVTDGNCQDATTAAGLPFTFLEIKRSWWRLRHFLPMLPSRPQLRVCVAPQFNSRQIFHNLCLGRLWKSFSKRRTRAVLSEKGLSVGVYEISSPAVKPDHGFMISSLTLKFVYLVGGCPKWKRQSGD